jgi:hypothetical protein
MCALLCACGGNEDKGFDLLAPCGDPDECSGGICIFPVHNVTGRYYCSQECSPSEPCPTVDGVQLVCADGNSGFGPAQPKVCSEPCTEGMIWRENGMTYPRVCIDGTPTWCDSLPAEQASLHCEACGCAPGERCTEGGCAPELTAGEPCEVDDDCQSKNCGVADSDDTTTLRCLTALGAPCTSDDCNACVFYGQPWCTKNCTDDFYCPTGWYCIGQDSGGGFRGTCRPSCYNGMPFGSSENCPAGFRCMLDGEASWCEQ